MVVAIDGPAGVGKSTIAARTAQKSGFYYLNSGNFYRAVTKAVLEAHIDQAKEQDIIAVAHECNLDIQDNCLYLNGEPVEEVIHTDLIDNRVSFFSTIPEVRDIVNSNLKRIASHRDVVVEGRDIGTVVFPDAEVKIFLDAHIDVRTQRRFEQGVSSLSREKIKETIQSRDHSDENKPVGSLKKAVDALYIDTSYLTIDQVCEKVLSEIRKKSKNNGRIVQVISGDVRELPKDNINEEQLQEQYIKNFQSVAEGQMIPGKVVEINPEYVFLDVGLKSEGKVPIDDFTEPLEIGETVYVILISKESKRGEVIVSKQKADEKIFWKNLRQAFDNHAAVAGKIDRKIKGGYEVDLGNGLRAFMPQSKADISRVKDSEVLVNLDTHFYVDRLYSKGKVNIVVTRKEWLEDEIKKKKEEFFAKTSIDDVLEGTVKSFTSFGAFIDLGGFDGLLHINDMSWRHITSPKDLVSLNEKLKLKLIRMDPEENKINLSLKHFTEDPWTHFEEKYQVGDVIKGQVTKLADFGAFIELEAGIEGLAHISELSWVKKIRHPKEILQVGDHAEVKILNYDIQQGKLSLGIKQVYSNPWDDIDKRYPVGMRLTRTIKNLTSFGAFLELEEGIDGLLHLDDMSWTKKVKHPSEILKEDQEIEVSIIDIDKNNRKIKLSIKQLEENPWTALAKAFPKGSIIDGEITGITDFGIFVKVQGGVEGLINKVNIFDQNVETLEEALAKYKIGDAIKVIVSDIKPARQKLSLSIREYNRKIQQEEMVKYIHDDSTEEKSTLADFIQDKSKN